MDRFECNGRLRITMVDGSPDLAGVKITHHRPHSQYVDISLTDKVDAIIQSMINMPASKAWDSILAQREQGELTEKQIYARWAQLNEEKWRLDDDQALSATKLLQSKEGHEVEIIPTIREDGISAVAFTFKGILEDVGSDIVEVAMDSTWKTNAAGYELYGLVGELNGRAVPLAFCFTASTDGTALEGAKDRLLRTVIRFVAKKCANIKFTLSDKDLTEINGFRTEIPHARHQLCYWHGVRYIEERLAQDKPPAKYSAIRANKVFNFIDPTWAPGVSSGWLEEGVHESDAEVERDAEPMPLDVDISKVRIRVAKFPTVRNCSCTIRRSRKELVDLQSWSSQ
ncbi:hypothetical protein GALMADRAFT_66460 [Galerina marginata CBS 339.88]|uniref:MULE transposase domain-containing protein n=1 Tax=Galerina marginata (strain CBS 339.88) TaxID=685588 RepID=A0A067T2C1_GALM3|nr:hypothetical protein GALMADRAFT_66460 [Galerina marginata CBS 339.88]